MRAMRTNWPRQARGAPLSSASALTGCAVVLVLALSLATTMWSPVVGAGTRHRAAARPDRHQGAGPDESPGPASQYDCTFNLATDAFTGADGSAAAIGWAGNHQGVVTCLGGTFLVQDGLLPRLRIRTLPGRSDLLGGCRRLPAGTDHVLSPSGSARDDHRVC